MCRLVALTLLLMAFLAGPAAAHEVRPALLDIEQTGPDLWQVTWKQPVRGDRALRLVPRLGPGWLDATPVAEVVTDSHVLRRWLVRADAAAVEGAPLAIDGLDRSITEVMVRVRAADGQGGETILRAGSPRTTIRLGAKAALAVPAYLWLGVRHILSGLDHLMFVLGLLLLIGGGGPLVRAITAFTIAHSLTLAASVLGFVSAPVAVVEALIAWSIVFVAFELTRGDGHGEGVTRRWPWLVAFVFGLLHGFGFAGALAETGLPAGEIPLALVLFNLGVEIGQLLFIGAVLLLAAAWRRWAGDRARRRIEPVATRRLVPYALGCYAAFLFIDRSQAAFA